MYPNLFALDEKVGRLLSSPAAKKWDIARREYEICRIHPIYFLEEYGWIKQAEMSGGSGEVDIIPFRLNNVQLQVADRLCKGLVPDRLGALFQSIKKTMGASKVCTLCGAWGALSSPRCTPRASKRAMTWQAGSITSVR